MAALKVSLSFLQEPVLNVIAKTSHIAEVMLDNDLFKPSPISPQGLKTAVDHLRDMEKKARSGRKNDIENRDIALNDVDDFIRQIAAFMNQCTDKSKLNGNGFDFTTDVQKSAGEYRVNLTGGLIWISPILNFIIRT